MALSCCGEMKPIFWPGAAPRPAAMVLNMVVGVEVGYAGDGAFVGVAGLLAAVMRGVAGVNVVGITPRPACTRFIAAACCCGVTIAGAGALRGREAGAGCIGEDCTSDGAVAGAGAEVVGGVGGGDDGVSAPFLPPFLALPFFWAEAREGRVDAGAGAGGVAVTTGCGLVTAAAGVGRVMLEFCMERCATGVVMITLLP